LSYAELRGIENLVGEFGAVAIPNANGVGFKLTTVPEPGTGMLALTATAMLTRRRRRN